ncbi:hypothetical protein GQ600_24633 [Phytophthora cactorum]|nr:hypothetical protein GQ600_24633 [Phytophthora cactorum]
MNKGGCFRDEHRRGRYRQSFRSQELLASLTLSAEAITLNSESGMQKKLQLEPQDALSEGRR